MNLQLPLYPGEALSYDQEYSVELKAQDVDGLWLEPGLVPNPWSFHTMEYPIYKFLLPIISRFE